jgi:hypothetical protein
MDERVLFPQANDFQKVIKIIYLSENELLDNQFMSKHLELDTDRQVSYYVNAAIYLGIINQEKKFTDFGWKLKEAGSENFKNMLAMKIVSKSVFGDVFFYKYFHGVELKNDEIAQLMLMYQEVNSDSVAERRASTVTSWLKWIESLKDL